MTPERIAELRAMLDVPRGYEEFGASHLEEALDAIEELQAEKKRLDVLVWSLKDELDEFEYDNREEKR